MSGDYSLAMLGGFAACRQGDPVELPPGCQRALALIALEREPVSCDHVCEALWPGVPASTAAARLRSVLWRLRCYGLEEMLQKGRHTIAIASGVYVDWWRAADLIFRALSVTTGPEVPQPPVLDELTPLLHAGELLESWLDDWVEPHRGRYRGLRALALGRLANWIPS